MDFLKSFLYCVWRVTLNLLCLSSWLPSRCRNRRVPMQWQVWQLMGSWPPRASPGLLSAGAHCVYKKDVKWFHCTNAQIYPYLTKPRKTVFAGVFPKGYDFLYPVLQNFSCASASPRSIYGAPIHLNNISSLNWHKFPTHSQNSTTALVKFLVSGML